MKYISKTFVILSFFLAIIVFAKGWQLITDGFRVDKIKTDLTAVVDEEELDQKIGSILNQKFHYLSKGSQTYVFESEDKNYVLKFARYKRYEIPFWIDYLDFFEAGRAFKKIKISHKQKLLNNSINSYKIAFEHLKDDTGVIYIHLNKTTKLPNNIQLKDRLNRSYNLNLNNFGFVVQKKAYTLESYLKSLIKKQDHEAIKGVVYSFLETITSIAKKGYINADYNCVKNSGYLDGKVVEIDLGSFLNRDLRERAVYKKEMVKFTKHFVMWANKNYPEIIPYYKNQIEEFEKKY